MQVRRIIINIISLFIPKQAWREAFKKRFNPLTILYGNLFQTDSQEQVNIQPNVQLKHPYSIGIVTYNKRFDKFFKPLIKAIRQDFQGEIIVCVNGNNKEDFDQEYRKEMLSFLSEYDNIYPMFFTSFRSLAKLWNNCILNATSNHMLLLNDDTSLDSSFWNGLHSAIEQRNYSSFKINGTWCHVFLNREEVDQIGWFDERFLGIGNEDVDFESRWFIHYNSYFPHIEGVEGLYNLCADDYTVVNQKQSTTKYSLINEDFFYSKYEITHIKQAYKKKIADEVQYPYEKFYWKNKEKM